MKIVLDLSYSQEELLDVETIKTNVSKREFNKIFKEELTELVELLIDDARQSYYMQEELEERLISLEFT